MEWTAEINEWVRSKFTYEPETGIVTNLDTREEAGCFDVDTGYRSICFSHDLLRAQGYERYTIGTHRLAWFLHNGVWPTVKIDHKNHICDDNRLDNLRLATDTQNAHNRLKAANYGNRPCHSKFKGVCWHKRKKRWAANIRVNGKNIHLGEFLEEAKAAEAYKAAAELHFGEFAFTQPKVL